MKFISCSYAPPNTILSRCPSVSKCKYVCVYLSSATPVEARTCSPEEYSCKSGEGECVPLAWMCDQSRDCSDGSDERACSKLPSLSPIKRIVSCLLICSAYLICSCRSFIFLLELAENCIKSKGRKLHGELTHEVVINP